MTNYNDGNWHGWNGGECPVHPETVVEVVTAQRGLVLFEIRRAGITNWDSNGEPIIAFRVIREHKEPREFWLISGSVHDSLPEAEGDCRIWGFDTAEIIHVREVLAP